MNKVECDKCHKIITKGSEYDFELPMKSKEMTGIERFQLCHECREELRKWIR